MSPALTPAISARTTSTSGRSSETPTSSRSSKPSNSCGLIGAAVHDPASEHRRRRSPQRLDLRVQCSVLAAARVRARFVHRRAGDSIGACRRGLGRLRRRRDLRAVRRRRGRRRDLPPDGRLQRLDDRRDRPGRQPLLQAPAAAGALSIRVGVVPRAAARPSAPRSKDQASTSRTSRSAPCSTRPRPERAWSRWGWWPRRWASISSGCWTSPRAAAGASGRSRGTRRLRLRAARGERKRPAPQPGGSPSSPVADHRCRLHAGTE